MPWAAPADASLRHSRQQSDQQYGRARKAKRGPDPRSTARWRKLRAMKLAQQPLCEHCQAQGRVTPATQVDHIVEVMLRPDLAFELGNLQSICHRHHAAKSAAERRGR